MPIRVACRCGQQFAAKDELAGKVVKCPKCGQALNVGGAEAAKPAPGPAPAASGVADLLDEIGFHVHKEDKDVQHCPACDAKLSSRAIICVECGFHLETNKFVKGVGGARATGPGKEEGHAGAAQMLLKKAENAIEFDKAEEFKIRTQGAPTWMLVTALSIIATFIVGMSLLPRDQAFFISGSVWVVACLLVAFYYNVVLIVTAFTESAKQGWLFLFVPFYALYYVFTRWANCGKAFLINVTVSILAVPGAVLVVISPKFKSEIPEGDTRALDALPRDRVVATAPMWPAGKGPVA